RGTIRLAEEDLGFGVALRRDQLELAGGLDDRDELDLGAAERHHRAERLLVHRLDRAEAEPGREHAVERGRGAAALDVDEDRGARFLAGALLDLAGQEVADAAQPDV